MLRGFDIYEFERSELFLLMQSERQKGDTANCMGAAIESSNNSTAHRKGVKKTKTNIFGVSALSIWLAGHRLRR